MNRIYPIHRIDNSTYSDRAFRANRQDDRTVKRLGISRSKFIIIILACEEALRNDAGEWPNGFLQIDCLKIIGRIKAELEENGNSIDDFDIAILSPLP